MSTIRQRRHTLGSHRYIYQVAHAVIRRDFPYRRDPYIRGHLKRVIKNYREACIALATAEPLNRR